MTTKEDNKKARVLRRSITHSKDGACVHCGWNKEISVLHFHHLDAQKKVCPIPRLCKDVVIGFCPIQVLLVEADKCDLLCPTCDDYLDWQERNEQK